MKTFQEIEKIDVSDKVEKKDTGKVKLSYLSWTWAWSELMKIDPNASYKILKFKNELGRELPYMYDEQVGYMVATELTVNGITHEMWLPAMNSSNDALKSAPYTYKTSKGEKYVQACDMFDINKTIMRCLVKNIAMFGLGLYIYAGEDLPQVDEEELKPNYPIAIQEGNTLSKEETKCYYSVPELRKKIEGMIGNNKFNELDIDIQEGITKMAREEWFKLTGQGGSK